MFKLNNNVNHPAICKDQDFTHMRTKFAWSHYFNKKRYWGHKMSVPSQGSDLI